MLFLIALQVSSLLVDSFFFLRKLLLLLTSVPADKQFKRKLENLDKKGSAKLQR